MIRVVFFDFWRTMFIPSVSLDEYFEIRVRKLYETLRNRISNLSLDDVRDSFWSIRRLCDSVRELKVEVPLPFEIKLMLNHLGYYFFDDDFIESLISSYMYPFVHCTRPRDELKHVLDGIRELNLRVGLISNVMSGRHIIEALKLWRLDDYFDAMIFSDNVGFRKPRPEIFKYALSMLNVDANDAVMIGDDFRADIEGALNINMKAIYLNVDDLKVNFKYVAKNLNDALKWIVEWLH